MNIEWACGFKWIFENVEDGQKIEVSVTVKVNEAASGELLKNNRLLMML